MREEGVQRMREDTGRANHTAEPAVGSSAVLWKTITVTTSTAVKPRHMLD